MASLETAIPPFRDAFRYWLKLGLISFGGPAGQIAIMQHDLVDQKKWIGQQDFLQALNFCMLLPGPEAQQLATYVGWRLHGWVGAVTAGVFFVLPGAVVLLGLAWLSATYGDTALVSAVFNGIKPMVIAIIAHAIGRIGQRILHGWQAVALAAAALAAIRWLHIDFPWIIAAAGTLGALSSATTKPIFPSATHGPTAVADEHERSNFSLAAILWRTSGLTVLYLFMLLAPFALLIAIAGSTPYVDIGLFFTKAAFVTFGGAYAVLPYIAEASVNQYGWTSAAEMLNGLALAETTPGPLILVTQYIGFFAGWKNPGIFDRSVTGVLAALATSYVTFLPSIFFILIGAPAIRGLGRIKAAATALAAISAAVVGVMTNLGLYLAEQVFFSTISGIDFYAVTAALVGFAALFFKKVSIQTLVLFGAVCGLLRLWLGL